MKQVLRRTGSFSRSREKAGMRVGYAQTLTPTLSRQREREHAVSSSADRAKHNDSHSTDSCVAGSAKHNGPLR